MIQIRQISCVIYFLLSSDNSVSTMPFAVLLLCYGNAPSAQTELLHLRRLGPRHYSSWDNALYQLAIQNLSKQFNMYSIYHFILTKSPMWRLIDMTVKTTSRPERRSYITGRKSWLGVRAPTRTADTSSKQAGPASAKGHVGPGPMPWTGVAFEDWPRETTGTSEWSSPLFKWLFPVASSIFFQFNWVQILSFPFSKKLTS